MNEKCEHGAERERHKQWPAGLSFTEPLNPCSCCGTLFYYIESAVYTEADDDAPISYGTQYEPKDRCETCGGAYSHFGPSFEDMGWETQCSRCKKFLKRSQLETHECPVAPKP